MSLTIMSLTTSPAGLVWLFGVAALLAVSPGAAETEVESCVDGNGKQIVEIEGCTTPPCVLVKETEVNFSVHFTPDASSQTLVHNVSGEINGMTHPFIGMNGTYARGKVFDGNDGKQVASFPLKANQSYYYKHTFEVKKFYPTMTIYVNWSLVNEKGEKPVCFRVKVKITNQKKSPSKKEEPPHDSL